MREGGGQGGREGGRRKKRGGGDGGGREWSSVEPDIMKSMVRKINTL